ncbi:25.6 kDa [Spodoptera frugiperda ascovirus 1a]|uniref:25.6 kDa n=1 Tax=Spodoptera frugiperda ascovirus 1a TaxID=113370 RepID=Q8JJY1_SFAVA|nr:25.6 kDa [Spodoptera frugiperda ascovirus 1a]CAC84467.1 O48L homologue [Spodoptera frugiperda ascovirus 1a]CAL44635.1 25.6 kDa [Spodoptera frugiperda ascovirus 1a]
MGTSLSTAVSKATQDTVQKIRNDNVNVDKATISSYIGNYIRSNDGTVTVGDISNVIHTKTSFASQLSNAVSDDMQAKTALSIMQNLMTQIKDINLLQTGMSVADTACISNVTLLAFTSTTNKCLTSVISNVKNEVVAKGSVNVRDISNTVDGDVFVQCTSSAAIKEAVSSSSHGRHQTGREYDTVGCECVVGRVGYSRCGGDHYRARGGVDSARCTEIPASFGVLRCRIRPHHIPLHGPPG